MERFKLSIEGRRNFSFLLIALIFIFLTGGLFKLQIFEHKKLLEQSENNRIRVVPIIPRRGLVFDRDGRVIIDNRPSYTVSIIVAEMIKDITIPNLSEIIALDTADIRKRLRRNMVSRYQPTPIKKDIPFEVVAILEEQTNRFPGVTYQMERVREYNDSIGGESFTGYVGEVSEDELSKTDITDLRLGSMIGKKGLEKEYDFLLRGREGTSYQEVYASGQVLGPYEGKKWVNASPGTDLTLTIDIDVQKACLENLTEFCCGAVVAMNPRTGGILGMVSFPGYDANIFSSVIPDSLWQAISNDENTPLLNRPLLGRYPPGSTTKFITIGAGLEEGIITEYSTFDPCLGGMQFGNRFFRCWDAGGHGTVNAVSALEQSCDVYLYQLGLKEGVDLLSEYFDKCGFGKFTGVDLPSEASGLNPNSIYYDKRYGKRKWTRALVMNNSIGQGEILVTPLQLAQFFCGLANDGVVYRPHIIKKQSLSTGEEINIEPQVAFTLPFSKNTLRILNDGLREVVEGKDGTAKVLKNDYYTIGGKTGTAQNPHGDNHSIFCGVAPLDEPEIVVFAIVENAGDGSKVAAPVVGKIIDVYMQKHGKMPVIDTTLEISGT